MSEKDWAKFCDLLDKIHGLADDGLTEQERCDLVKRKAHENGSTDELSSFVGMFGGDLDND